METFQCKDGRMVELDWDDDNEMTVWTTGNPREKIGSFVFQHVEGLAKDGSDEYFLVTNMHLEGPNGGQTLLKQGIGREILKCVGEFTPIVFSPDDGHRRDDGSHLTDMGPGFASRMVEAGLAGWGR